MVKHSPVKVGALARREGPGERLMGLAPVFVVAPKERVWKVEVGDVAAGVEVQAEWENEMEELEVEIEVGVEFEEAHRVRRAAMQHQDP